MLAPLLPASLVLAAGAFAYLASAPPVVQDPPMERPSPHHERVLRGAGHWKGKLTMFMPGMPPQTVDAEEIAEPIGKFWLRTQFHCSFMGMAMEGSALFGYSATDKKFVGTWTDSMSSYLAMMEGEYDEERDLIIMRWKAPYMGTELVPHHYELAQKDDSYTSTFFVEQDGKTVKNMVIEMQRSADGDGDK
ncbi:MAG: DUF1579 family protein [Planctomycetota bacterium]